VPEPVPAFGIARRVGAVLLAWLALLAIEHLIVSVVYRDYFSGSWELWPSRTCAMPITLAALLLVAPFVVLLSSFRDSRGLLRVVGGLSGAALGYGITFGRHFASWALRAPMIALLAAVGAVVLSVSLPRLTRQRAPLLLAIAAISWAADAWVLPRLYPTFHFALLLITLCASGLFALLYESKLGRAPLFGLAIAIASVGWAPFAAPRLANYGNLRMIMGDHAPVLSRGLRVASFLAPPPPEDEGVATTTNAEVQRALDWTGRDVVLISVDALRADHVGAYGYARPTTPHLDALALEGTTFEDAYCPTPHTSYSVTSMMTGKYMRPLLALGLGQDSETWAAQLRRYDYKTAAFYPPAVFFIDTDRFERFRRDGLDFEYRKEEFADPALRAAQVAEYLQHTPTDHPVFLWVHFFEPHEPYVTHAEHAFGDTEKDAYDSEIAAADDGIGQVVAIVRARRPDAVVIVTADHGEEFGEHGGRYHGTTVYEEQVRVPLVIVGPGVAVNARVRAPVQTIDLLPTTLSALGIPQPARLRGRDLGLLLAHPETKDKGLAFAETDDYELYAENSDRLVCDKRSGACAMYDVSVDGAEMHDTSRTWPDKAKSMRAELVGVAHAHGKFEGQGGVKLPEALRLGMQGDVGAAPEVATLLDDANVEIRRRAATVLYALHGRGVVPELRRSLDREEDEHVKHWVALALVRAGEVPSLQAESLLRSQDFDDRKLAALAFADHGDKRAIPDLVEWYRRIARDQLLVELTTARDIVAALGRLKANAAVPDLAFAIHRTDGAALRLRAYVADALGAIGDRAAVPDLVSALDQEAQASTRLHEARALGALGAKGELAIGLAKYAISVDPMLEAVTILREAGALEPRAGGAIPAAGKPLHEKLRVGPGLGRVVVLVEQDTAGPLVLDGVALSPRVRSGNVSMFESETSREELEVSSPSPATAIWATRTRPTRALAPDGGFY